MGTLFIVGTPIGNIEDITLRGLRYIFEADATFSEDTRQFKKLKSIIRERYTDLFEPLEINAKKDQANFSYREQNHTKAVTHVTDNIDNGQLVILTSDNGMPAISDPGYKLVRDVLDRGHSVEVVPGPTAVTSALVQSGLSTDRYVFIGFLPRKRSRIIRLIEKYIEHENTIIYYESPFRIIKSMEIISEAFGPNVLVSASNDITKKFEKVFRGRVVDVIEELQSTQVRGEWTVCIRGQV